mmetsp:Transcript_49114/g.72971  ORF Transcript_49114/g.72971 Transcript_49114/m.72971 type:complete len:160 (+) Transcript_49114:77-556(+)
MDFAGSDQTKDKRQLEEIFVLSNASGNGLLSIPELQSVLELMGKQCQQHEVLSMVASVNSRATNDLNFDEFVKLMDALIDRPYSEAEIDEAFESLSAGSTDAQDGSQPRYIATDRFRELMMTLGDKFSKAQVDEMLQYLDDQGTNKIDRHTFGKIFRSF